MGIKKIIIFIALLLPGVTWASGNKGCLPPFIKKNEIYYFSSVGTVKVLESSDTCWLKVKILSSVKKNSVKQIWVNLNVVSFISSPRRTKTGEGASSESKASPFDELKQRARHSSIPGLN